MTPEALRERAIILYERMEFMDDGKIDAILAEFTALVAEARQQAEASRRVPELDNHHNALACGYCAGPLKEEHVRLVALAAEADAEARRLRQVFLDSCGACSTDYTDFRMAVCGAEGWRIRALEAECRAAEARREQREQDAEKDRLIGRLTRHVGDLEARIAILVDIVKRAMVAEDPDQWLPDAHEYLAALRAQDARG